MWGTLWQCRKRTPLTWSRAKLALFLIMKSKGPSERRREKASRCWAVSIRVCKLGRQNFSRSAIKSLTALVSPYCYDVVVVRGVVLRCWNNGVGRSSVWTASAQGWELPNNHASSADLKLTKRVTIEVEDEIIVGSRIPTWGETDTLKGPRSVLSPPECSSCSIGFFFWLILNWH